MVETGDWAGGWGGEGGWEGDWVAGGGWEGAMG